MLYLLSNSSHYKVVQVKLIARTILLSSNGIERLDLESHTQLQVTRDPRLIGRVVQGHIVAPKSRTLYASISTLVVTDESKNCVFRRASSVVDTLALVWIKPVLGNTRCSYRLQ